MPDKIRFPNGMKAVSDYMHSKGLLFGLYAALGNHTCSHKMPGSYGPLACPLLCRQLEALPPRPLLRTARVLTALCALAAHTGHIALDAKTLASWDIDLLKVDTCIDKTADHPLGTVLYATEQKP